MVRIKQQRRFLGFKAYFSDGHTTPPNLPDDVLETIFTFMPVKNAVKIGVLSKRFRNSWLQSRRLIFDKELVRYWGRQKVISIVSKVFDLYEGAKILCFKLCFDPYEDKISLVESWITKCTEKGVEELDLDFFISSKIVQLSYGILDIQSLKTLKLTFCHLNLPPKLKGLNFLNNLILRMVQVSSMLVETIISNCLCLETLDLFGCDNISGLRIISPKLKVLKVGNCVDVNMIDIDAPALHSFYYHGYILRVLRVANVGKLNDVLLNFKPIRTFNIQPQVANLVRHLSQVSVLTTTCMFLEALSLNFMGGIFRYEFCFWNLKELELHMDGGNFCNKFDIVSFVRHCPRLEKFFMDIGCYTFECGEYWKLHQEEDFEKFCDVFNCLRVMKLSGVKFQKLEIELLKYFLKRARKLENLVLVTHKCKRLKGQFQEIMDHIRDLHSCRVSPVARIAVYERFGDKSNIHPTHNNKIWD